MSPEQAPAASRRELAKLLRELRKSRDLALDEVASATGMSVGFLSRVERGLRGLGDDNADRLSTYYRVPATIRDHVRQLAQRGRQVAWWDHAEIPRSLKEFIGLEQSATAIATYGSIVPGLLQTAAYAEATISGTTFEVSAHAREVTVASRLRRQEVLTKADPPWLRVILDESGIRRRTGSAETMREQLEALVVAASKPRVSIQILPLAAGAHLGMDSRFTIVSTSQDHAPELVHIEGLAGGRTLERPTEIGLFEQAWRTLSATALSPDESIIMLTDAARPGSST